MAGYKGLASLYADRSDNQRALKMLASAREIARADPETDSEEGLVLVRAGRWSEAEPLLKKTLAAQPENENVLSTLGIVGLAIPPRPNQSSGIVFQGSGRAPGAGRLQRIRA